MTRARAPQPNARTYGPPTAFASAALHSPCLAEGRSAFPCDTRSEATHVRDIPIMAILCAGASDDNTLSRYPGRKFVALRSGTHRRLPDIREGDGADDRIAPL